MYGTKKIDKEIQQRDSNTNNITMNAITRTEFAGLSRKELLDKCKELKLSKYSSKNKQELCDILSHHNANIEEETPSSRVSLKLLPQGLQIGCDAIVKDVSIDIVDSNVNNGRLINIENGIEYIDLFCGIGGFHQAMKRINNNSKCVFASDIDEKCRDTYENNYKIKPHGDITKVKINDIPNFDIICGGFPCFIEGTKVLTNEGYKKIEDVVIQDKLLTHAGNFQNIVHLQRKKYNGELYDLEINNRPSNITCTEEHPFYIREKQLYKSIPFYKEAVWKPAKELTRNDYVGMVVNTCDKIPEFIFDEIDVTTKNTMKLDKSEYWYEMGLFIVDDRISDSGAWRNILKEFVKDIEEKVIPEWVQDAPIEFIQNFIDGFVDADGHNTGISYNLAFGIQRLYLKLGIIFSLLFESDNNSYTMIRNWKTSSFIEDNYAWFPIIEITKKESKETSVYNFEVENDNSYIVENVIVHNCQTFSNSGKKKGFEDNRGQLFENILAIAMVRKPSFMFLENVKHIKKIDNGKVFEHICQRINETGYTVVTTELSPHQLGIPQQRERIVFVCVRNDIYDKDKILTLSPTVQIPIDIDKIFETDKLHTDRYKISPDEEKILNVWDLMIQKFDAGENLSPTILCNEFNTIYTEVELNNLPTWKRDYIDKNKPIYNKYKIEWDKWYEEHREILHKKEIYGKLEWQTGRKKANDSIFNHFIQLRQSGIRVKKAEYFPTLVAIVQTPIYAKERRYITPRECARLQSFPDDFIMHKSDHIAYKQFGNAVNVDVVHFVISNTLKSYNLL
jgi:DNA (cytosine-5)-methyltransferase 1